MRSASEPLFLRVAPSLFQKKKGARLVAAIPFVRELYGPHDPDCQNSSDSSRAHEIGSILHLRVHSIPYGGIALAIRLAVIACVVFAWLTLSSSALKLRCVLSAILYSVAESAFTYGERGTSYTSFSQFVAVVLYAPLLLDAYGALLGDLPLLYVSSFPLNVWLLELVVGAALAIVHGFNVAWCYADYADAFACEQARLGHAPAWLALGCGCAAGYPLAIRATESAIQAGVVAWWWPLVFLLLAGLVWRVVRPPIAVPRVHWTPGTRAAAVVRAIGATEGFRPTWWLPTGHMQSVYYGVNGMNFVLPQPAEAECWVTADGGTVQLVWPCCAPHVLPVERGVVVVLPGLGGTARSSGEASAAVLAAGLRPVIFEPRGLASLPLSSPRVNLFGNTDDLREALVRVQRRFPGAPIGLLATSAGTATAVRYLGEQGARTPVVAAALNCPGYDIALAMARCSPLFGRLLLNPLKSKLLTGQSGELLRQAHPEACERVARARNLHELLVHLAPFAGPTPPAESAADPEAWWDYVTYLRQCNPMGTIRNIRTEVLVLNADDDPVCTAANMEDALHHFGPADQPEPGPRTRSVLLQLPKGGHCGFYSGAWRPRNWGLSMAVQFIHAFMEDRETPLERQPEQPSLAPEGKRATRSPARVRLCGHGCAVAVKASGRRL